MTNIELELKLSELRKEWRSKPWKREIIERQAKLLKKSAENSGEAISEALIKEIFIGTSKGS